MKKLYPLFIFFLCLISFNKSNAQGAPAYAWVRNSINAVDLTYTSVAVDNTNHFIYCAGSYSSGYFDVGTGHQYNASNGSTDIFLVKYDESGTAIWAKSFGGFGDDHATGIACDLSGNVYVTGYFDSDSLQFGTTTLRDTSSTNLLNSFLTKFDNSGNVLWSKGITSIGGAALSHAIAIDNKGRVYITGQFLYNAHCGTFSATSTLGGLFVTKYKADGTEMWMNNSSVGSASSGGTATGESIAIDASFNCVVSGSYVDQADFSGIPSVPSSNPAYIDRIVCKLDTGGQFLWAKGEGVWQGPDDNESVAVDDTGNIYLGGYLSYPTVSPNNTSYNSHYFLQKLNPSGLQQWFVMGDTTTGIHHSIYADAVGNTYMAMNALDTTSIPPFTVNPQNYFGLTGVLTLVVKYDNQGSAGWVKAIHGGSFLPPTAVAQGISHDDAGNIFVTGSVQDSCFFDTHLATGDLTFKDFYLAKLGTNPVNDVQTITSENPDVIIYPNPSSSQFYLHFNKTIIHAEIQIYDMQGNVVSSLNRENANDILWNSESFSTGAYLCRIVMHSSNETEPIVTSRTLLIQK